MKHLNMIVANKAVYATWRLQDVGPVALGFRLLEKMVDLNALFTLASPIMHRMPDFQQQLAALRSSPGRS